MAQLNKAIYIQSIISDREGDWGIHLAGCVAIKMELDRLRSTDLGQTDGFKSALKQSNDTYLESIGFWEESGKHITTSEWKKLPWKKRCKLDKDRWVKSQIDVEIWKKWEELNGLLTLAGH